MKQQLAELLGAAMQPLIEAGILPESATSGISLERTRDSKHGDFACNIAMKLAKPAGQNPRDLAQVIINNLPPSAIIEKLEIAGPGFINIFVNSSAQNQIIEDILTQTDNFGRHTAGNGKRIQIEFVSANPTGPLHIGHGRGAAYGAAVANLLEVTGHSVEREYYVNDAGRQMDILAVSLWLRYLNMQGEIISFPENAYQGDYVNDLAESLREQHGERFQLGDTQLTTNPDEDADSQIDALIAQMRELLGRDNYQLVHNHSLTHILAGIRTDLKDFNIPFQNWFSEQSLADDGTIDRMLDRLETEGHIFEKEGAKWFRSTNFGDEKDRVVVRENGLKTYFASDIAYHMNKLERGFDTIIDIWGADHHGYVPRVRASLQALGADPDQLEILLVQFAALYRGDEKVPMSTRSGSFVSLRELYEETGTDAARFFYVLRRCEQHLDFDLELAKSQSNDNPVYYIQYAHARICSVFRQLEDKKLSWDQSQGSKHLHLLAETHESALITALARYPELIITASQNREPHQLAHYLRDLANAFHTYYNAHVFLVDDEELRNARLNLVAATRQILKNGLTILDVSAPEQM